MSIAEQFNKSAFINALNTIGKELHEEFTRNEEVCAHVIDLFQLMANKQRFRIVCILIRGEFCVNEIASILGTDKVSNISQQLKVLRLSGVIRCVRDEKRMIYSLVDERFRELITFLKQGSAQRWLAPNAKPQP